MTSQEIGAVILSTTLPSFITLSMGAIKFKDQTVKSFRHLSFTFVVSITATY